MNKKRLYIILSLILLSVVIFFSITKIHSGKYRKQIPAIPDLSTANEQLKEQIVESDKKARSKVSGENIGWLGMVYYSANDYNRAKQCFQLAILKDANNWKWHYLLGYLSMEMGESAEAAKNMKQVTILSPKVAIAWYRLGEIYEQMNSTEQAIIALNRVTSLNLESTQIQTPYRSVYYPLQVYAKFLLAKIYMATDSLKKAETELEEISTTYRTFGSAFRQLGALFKQQNKTELSKKYTSRANDLNVFSPPVDTLADRISLISRADTYVLKHIDNAIYGADTRWTYELITQALKNIPHNKYIISKAVRQFPQMGLGNQITPLLSEHFSYFVNDYDEMIQVGIRLADAGLKKEATIYFEHALTFSDKSPEENATLAGMFFEKTGMQDKAITLMNKELKQNPDNIKILGDGIFLFLQTGNTQLAKQYYTQLQKLSPGNKKLKIFDGMLAEISGKPTQALVLYEQAFKSNPKNLFLIQRLSSMYYKNEMWAEAIRFFQTALAADPNNANLQMQLGLQLVTCPNEKLRNLTEGKEYSERAFYNSRFTIDDKISAGRTLALAYYQMDNISNARFYINETIKLATNAQVPQSYLQNLKNLAKQFKP